MGREVRDPVGKRFSELRGVLRERVQPGEVGWSSRTPKVDISRHGPRTGSTRKGEDG